MKIERAEVVHEGIYRVLRLMIDGRPADVFEPKLTLLDAGLVVLLDDDRYWEEAVAAKYYSEEHPSGLSIPGAVNDKELVRVVRRFVNGETDGLLEIADDDLTLEITPESLAADQGLRETWGNRSPKGLAKLAIFTALTREEMDAVLEALPEFLREGYRAARADLYKPEQSPD